jgi:hypothetical protein
MWSIVLLLLIIAAGYYWFDLLPRLKEHSRLTYIVREVIPKIADDIEVLRKSIKSKGQSSRDIPLDDMQQLLTKSERDFVDDEEENGLGRLRSAISRLEDKD